VYESNGICPGQQHALVLDPDVREAKAADSASLCTGEMLQSTGRSPMMNAKRVPSMEPGQICAAKTSIGMSLICSITSCEASPKAANISGGKIPGPHTTENMASKIVFSLVSKDEINSCCEKQAHYRRRLPSTVLSPALTVETKR
jgi:hypothetical protein